jgi:hypothetical protein
VGSFTHIIASLRRLSPDSVPLQPAPAERAADSFTYVNAYEAEGLLGVCLFIVRNVSPSVLLPHWPLYVGVAFSCYHD